MWIPRFWCEESTSGDTRAAKTRATASGFTTTAGSSKIILVEALEEDMANTGYGYIRLAAVEVVNNPVLGGVMFIGGSLEKRDAIRTALT